MSIDKLSHIPTTSRASTMRRFAPKRDLQCNVLGGEEGDAPV